MLKKRIIPVLLIENKNLVKTINFKNKKYVGDPLNAIKIFNEKFVDELIILDINQNKTDQEILGLLGELIHDFKEQDNLKKIESLEKELINNLDENSYSELIKLKSQLNRE